MTRAAVAGAAGAAGRSSSRRGGWGGWPEQDGDGDGRSASRGWVGAVGLGRGEQLEQRRAEPEGRLVVWRAEAGAAACAAALPKEEGCGVGDVAWRR